MSIMGNLHRIRRIFNAIYPSSPRPSISSANHLCEIYSRVKRGMRYSDALREVNERFDIIESPATVTTPITTAWGIANNEVQSVALKANGEVWAWDPLGDDTTEIMAENERLSLIYRTEIAVTSGGKVVDTFEIERDGDDFVVRIGDGRILRGSSVEDVMNILQSTSEQQAVEELPEEDPLEVASRFDIIEIE